jgi:tetratricopeptide (TPR) repeat protein
MGDHSKSHTMKPLFKALAISLLFVSLCASTYAQKAKTYYKTAHEFLESKNYDDALTQFSKALEIEPDYIDAYMARGQIYEFKGELEKAKTDYERALTFETKSEELYYLAANINYKMAEYPESINKINQALTQNSKFLQAVQLQVKVYVALERYNDALLSANKALNLRYNAYNLYVRGTIYNLLNDNEAAEKDFDSAIKKNKSFQEAYIALAQLSMKMFKTDQALMNINQAIEIDAKNTEAYLVRSKINIESLKYAEAINDISKNIILEPENIEWYLVRGNYYLDYAQYQNAINDFNKAVSIDNKNADAYYKRAFAYEQVQNLPKAIADYQKLTELSEYDVNAKKLLDEANVRLFELNRESVPPTIAVKNPAPFNNTTLNVPRDQEDLTLTGLITDDHEIKSLNVNDKAVQVLKTEEGFEFITEVDIEEIDNISITATDVYDNVQNLNLQIARTEIDLPVVSILAPIASDNGEIYLDSDAPSLYIEGQIMDESTITSIMVGGVSASYRIDENNPKFTATIDIMNKNSFEVTATDQFGNVQTQTFKFNRDAVAISENNPMGKTWVVFIENANYESFASLEGPAKDVSMMRGALANYKIHNIIHKKDMSKKEIERFFAIELRDLVRSNRVNSLMVWYAGHGKFVNQTGYWIPTDAKRDDEFTYFNINALRASLQAYSNEVTHVLVVTDACESGPTFYQAMRNTAEDRSCNNWEDTKLKSRQVFSSAGYELAVDNSQFTRTFANTLNNSSSACVPIDEVVKTVSNAVTQNNQQKPKFGKIAGLEDENGTFFFIPKD